AAPDNESAAAATTAPRDADEVLLRAAMRFIEEHLAELPALDAVAVAVGTPEKRLSQVFRQRTGNTVFAFARQLRLHKGKELLASSELGMQDIAELIGFRSAANFATAFREQQGVTPSEFRQQSRATHPPDGAAS
ncbi:helix-turn-helix domain-containing protein, partial [Leptospira sp. SA-E8]|uniref:helix-turn-helix domain-containing protein n=1 Tax=Leptospira sp. SA-E8 TaxID=3422259 RepID=UPI003EBB8530